MEFITPRVDIGFKKLFGVEENKDLLLSLINSLVSREDRVADVILMNPYNPRNFRQDKLSVLDIKVTSERGKRVNIEIQIRDEADYDKRALYYWAKLYTEQLKAAQDYSTLAKAIGIHILNFPSLPSEKKYHNVFHIREKDRSLLSFKDLEVHTIELTKFLENGPEDAGEVADLVSKIRTSLDIWGAFLTRHDLMNKEDLPKALDTPELKKALDVLERMTFGREEREAYEDPLKWLRIEANTLKKYETKWFSEGKEEGKAEGRGEEKLETAKAMRAEGISLSH